MSGSTATKPRFVANPEQIAERITVAPTAGRVRAVFAGLTVAESTAALVLRETGYPPRVYFPPADVRMDLLRPTERRTYCPFKGEASYWTLEAGGETLENAAWSYPEPHAGMAAIAGRIGFVEAVEIDG
jgi:uncharacterized protein (DUF427 family)